MHAVCRSNVRSCSSVYPERILRTGYVFWGPVAFLKAWVLCSFYTQEYISKRDSSQQLCEISSGMQQCVNWARVRCAPN